MKRLFYFVFILLMSCGLLGCQKKVSSTQWSHLFERQAENQTAKKVIVDCPKMYENFLFLGKSELKLNSTNKKTSLIVLAKPFEDSQIYVDEFVVLVKLADGWTALKQTANYLGGYALQYLTFKVEDGKKSAILVSTSTGGSGNYQWFNLYVEGEQNFEKKLSPAMFKGLSLKTAFVKDGKVFLAFQETKKEIVFDLKEERKELNDKKLFLGAVHITGLADSNKDKISEFRFVQPIKGTCNADNLGYLVSFWQYENGHLKFISYSFE